MRIDTIQEFAGAWKDDQAFHAYANNHFAERVNAFHPLRQLRDHVEKNGYGFGERSFYWMWKLIHDDLRANQLHDRPALEIGVHKGQILALWRLLGFWQIIGLSPMNGADGYDGSCDYSRDVTDLIGFVAGLTGIVQKPVMIHQYPSQSMNPYLANFDPLDALSVLYIDGGHSYEEAWFDIRLYAETVAIGGYMVIDDCANTLNLPQHFFAGHPAVSRAVDTLLPPFGKWPGMGNWQHIGNVVHNRIFQRIN